MRIRASTFTSSGPLYRVRVGDDGRKLLMHDDAATAHTVRRFSWSQGFRHTVRTLSNGKADVAEGGGSSASRIVAKGLEGWSTWAFLGFYLVGGFVGITWAFVMSVRTEPLMVAIGGGIIALFVWTISQLERKRGNTSKRAGLYSIAALRLLQGRCGVCDYDLEVHAQTKPTSMTNALSVTELAPQATQCPECSAYWNVQAWRESYVLDDDTRTATRSSATQHALLNEAIAHGRFGRPTVNSPRVLALKKARKPEVLRKMPAALKTCWRQSKVFFFGMLLTSGMLAVISVWFTKLQLWPTGQGREIVPYLLPCMPLGMLCLAWIPFTTITAREMVERDALQQGLCAHCETPLTRVLSHADNCIVCKVCGARCDSSEVASPTSSSAQAEARAAPTP